MMNLKREDFKKVLRVFSSVYKAGENIEIGDAWEKRVMVRVKGLEPLTFRRGLTALFEGYVWHFVPAAAVIFLVLGALLYQQMDFLSECEMARVFVETGFDDSLFQILGAS
ncbi:MAG: hypothetical protein R6X27_17055 [Candidatus Desulfacyla sp.]